MIDWTISFLFACILQFGAAFFCVGFAGAFFMPENIGRRKIMETQKEMYLILFNAITEATRILEEAQKKAEEIFINQE